MREERIKDLWQPDMLNITAFMPETKPMGAGQELMSTLKEWKQVKHQKLS